MSKVFLRIRLFSKSTLYILENLSYIYKFKLIRAGVNTFDLYFTNQSPFFRFLSFLNQSHSFLLELLNSTFTKDLPPYPKEKDYYCSIDPADIFDEAFLESFEEDDLLDEEELSEELTPLINDLWPPRKVSKKKGVKRVINKKDYQKKSQFKLDKQINIIRRQELARLHNFTNNLFVLSTIRTKQNLISFDFFKNEFVFPFASFELHNFLFYPYNYSLYFYKFWLDIYSSVMLFIWYSRLFYLKCLNGYYTSS